MKLEVKQKTALTHCFILKRKIPTGTESWA